MLVYIPISYRAGDRIRPSYRASQHSQCSPHRDGDGIEEHEEQRDQRPDPGKTSGRRVGVRAEALKNGDEIPTSHGMNLFIHLFIYLFIDLSFHNYFCFIHYLFTSSSQVSIHMSGSVCCEA